MVVIKKKKKAQGRLFLLCNEIGALLSSLTPTQQVALT